MKAYADAQQRIRSRSRTWLVTGTAGFIAGHLAEKLLKLDQNVVGLDNFSTGKRENLSHIRASVGEARWKRFRFIEGDMRSLATCREACAGAEVCAGRARQRAALDRRPGRLERQQRRGFPQHAGRGA